MKLKHYACLHCICLSALQQNLFSTTCPSTRQITKLSSNLTKYIKLIRNDETDMCYICMKAGFLS